VAEFRQVAERDPAPAHDRAQEFGPATIFRELADRDNRASGLVTSVDQDSQEIGPPISVARASPVTGRCDRVAENLRNTSPVGFATEINGSNRRIGGAIIASPFSPIGAIIAPDTTSGTATNGGLSIACRIFTAQISNITQKPPGQR
jgi:hypothetical protein